MTIEEILKKCPGLEKVTFSEIIKILENKLPLIRFNPNKTWKEMGLDDLDTIELIMELEKRLDFVFMDDLYDHVFRQDLKPINFLEIIRQKKLNDLGI
jgi:acyl carrier protein